MRIYKKLCYSEQIDPAHYMNLYLPDDGDTFPVFVYFIQLLPLLHQVRSP